VFDVKIDNINSWRSAVNKGEKPERANAATFQEHFQRYSKKAVNKLLEKDENDTAYEDALKAETSTNSAVNKIIKQDLKSLKEV
jgi:hypothetical protein